MKRVENYTIDINGTKIGLRWGMKFYRVLKQDYGLTIHQLGLEATLSEEDVVAQGDLVHKIIQSAYKANTGSFYDVEVLSEFIDDMFDEDISFVEQLFTSLLESQGKQTDATPQPKAGKPAGSRKKSPSNT